MVDVTNHTKASVTIAFGGLELLSNAPFKTRTDSLANPDKFPKISQKISLVVLILLKSKCVRLVDVGRMQFGISGANARQFVKLRLIEQAAVDFSRRI